MSNDSEGLIQHIIDSPGDDAPRLVYADWLEEHGDAALAELIRVQCALAAGGPDTTELENRERALLGRPENQQLREWGNEFRRGLIAGGSWYGSEDRFDFTDAPLDRIVSMALDFGDSNWPAVEDAQRMAAAPWMRRVTRIAFHEFGIEPGILRALASSPHLLNVREVVFSDSTSTADELADLLLAPSVRGVRLVMLQGDSGGWGDVSGALHRLFADPRAAQLRRLRLAALGIEMQSPAVLEQVARLPGLRLEINERLGWVAPVRASLTALLGDRVQFDAGTFDDPYGFTEGE